MKMTPIPASKAVAATVARPRASVLRWLGVALALALVGYLPFVLTDRAVFGFRFACHNEVPTLARGPQTKGLIVGPANGIPSKQAL